MLQPFASVQLFQGSESSQSAQLWTLFRKHDPSPLIVVWEGPSPFAAMGSLGFHLWFGFSADSSGIEQKISADNMTWS